MLFVAKGVWRAADSALYIYAGEDKNIYLQNDMYRIAWTAPASSSTTTSASSATSASAPTSSSDGKAVSGSGSGSGSGGGWGWSRVAFAASGESPADRYAHTMVYRAADDTAVVFGGYGGEMTVFDDCHQFAFATRRWRPLSDAAARTPSARHAHAALLTADQRMLVLVCVSNKQLTDCTCCSSPSDGSGWGWSHVWDCRAAKGTL
jgi:hypothetical protein